MTTVSKRGRPNAPGPAGAFISAMCERTVHYMAACDQNDEKNVECLLDWSPPVMNAEEQYYEDTPLVASIKSDMDSMTPAQINLALKQAEAQKYDITMQLRDIKMKLQQKGFEDEKARLQEMQLTLQEQEAEVMNVIADLKKK